MITDRTECPQCRSLQRFARKHRRTDPNTVQSYCRCLECNHEILLGVQTWSEFLKSMRHERRAKLLAMRARARRR